MEIPELKEIIPPEIPEPTPEKIASCARYLETHGFLLRIAGSEDFKKAAYVCAKLSATHRKGIIVSGPTGVGKTRFVDTITRHTRSIAPRTWISLGTSGWEDRCDPEWWHAVYAQDIFAGNLVLDDFGADYVKCNYGTREDLVGRLLMDYHLYGRGRLFITTNLTPEDIANQRDNRLMSRIQGLCMGLCFTGPSKRNMNQETCV